MANNLLFNTAEFKIVEGDGDGEKGAIYCKKLIESWTPKLETEMLEAFIRLYNDEMYGNWGPDNEEEAGEYWPEISSPADLVKYTGTDVTLYALEDAVYARSKTGPAPYESQNVPVCVILQLHCPWDEENGWAAVFIDDKFVKVDSDIVDCVYLD